MKKRKIFYSIKVECEDTDTFDFVRLNNPKGFQYEYVEDIPEVKESRLHPLFHGLEDVFSGKALRELENKSTV